MKQQTLVRTLLMVGLVFAFISCSKDEPAAVDSSKSFIEGRHGSHCHLFRGPKVSVGNGKARSWILVNAAGKPMELGVEFTPAALEGLGTTEEQFFALPLHHKAKAITPFDHIGLNWNPNGHPPPGVFDVPHFDVHFYMISLADQLAIPAWSPATDALFNNYPPDGYLPASYGTPPGPATAEAQMGKHWSPLNLGDYLPFSKILILGSYDGAVTFIEPMVTRDYLMNGADFSAPYPQPLYFAEPGNYPTGYNVYHNPANGHIYVTLSGFVARE